MYPIVVRRRWSAFFWRKSVLLGIALPLLLVGCGQQKAPPIQPPEVTVTQPERRDVRITALFTGTTRAIEAAEVRARVAGTLMSIEFEPSHFVDKGQLLFVIEQDQYRALRDEARATLKSAQSELARAESDLERVNKAIATNAVSEQDLDRAKAQRDQAEASVLAAQAQLSKTQLDLSYTEVRSPIAGQVSRNFVDAGNLVGHTDPTLLTTVNKMDPIFVYFDVPENLVLRFLQARRDAVEQGELPEDRPVFAGDPDVYVALATDSGYPHPAWVDYIDNTVDPNTGTIQMRAVIPNPDQVIFPGLFVRIKVMGPVQPDAVLVDERAVGTDLGGKFVLVLVENDVVEQRYVTLGDKQEDGMVVVTEGLIGDETYIVNGIMRARPGLPVTPLTVTEAAARTTAGTAVTQGGR